MYTVTMLLFTIRQLIRGDVNFEDLRYWNPYKLERFGIFINLIFFILHVMMKDSQA